MKYVSTQMDRAYIRVSSAAFCAKNRIREEWDRFCRSEGGMTTVEVVLLIAIAVVAAGLLSGMLTRAIGSVEQSLTDFLDNPG